MDVQPVAGFASLVQSAEFLSALIGALVGGSFALGGSVVATLLSKYFNDQQVQQEKLDILQSTLEAIATELQVLFDRYQLTMGQHLANLPFNSSLNLYYYATENYITIFDNNARLLGNLKDKVLRDLIIRTYINIKALLDGFKLNNTMYGNYETLKFYDVQGAPPIIKERLQNLEIARQNMGNELKQEHDHLCAQIPELILRITNTIKNGVF